MSVSYIAGVADWWAGRCFVPLMVRQYRRVAISFQLVERLVGQRRTRKWIGAQFAWEPTPSYAPLGRRWDWQCYGQFYASFAGIVPRSWTRSPICLLFQICIFLFTIGLQMRKLQLRCCRTGNPVLLCPMFSQSLWAMCRFREFACRQSWAFLLWRNFQFLIGFENAEYYFSRTLFKLQSKKSRMTSEEVWGSGDHWQKCGAFFHPMPSTILASASWWAVRCITTLRNLKSCVG